jgi:hypothetical protein
MTEAARANVDLRVVPADDTPDRGCFVCSLRTSALLPTGDTLGASLCRGCVTRAAWFALNAPPATLALGWRIEAPHPLAELYPENDRARVAAFGQPSNTTRVDLGIAYFEMGLEPDALASVATALVNQVEGAPLLIALRLFFHETLVRPGVLTLLRRCLTAQRARGR